MKKPYKILQIVSLLFYIGMLYVNYLANALPINNTTTGEAADRYPNLFTPAGITFSIWGIIYMLLAIYSFYQLGIFSTKLNEDTKKLVEKINPLYIITSIANISWIFAWHYNMIWLALIIMVTLLILLIKISDIIKNQNLSKTNNFLIQLPFSIYFGWISIATIANVTVLLVSLNWNGFGISPVIWTVGILLVGAFIGVTRSIIDNNAAYLMVFIWAYSGILYKHMSSTGFSSQYPLIIYTLFITLLFYVLTLVFLVRNTLFRKR